jgi:diacylglycerol kinase
MNKRFSINERIKSLGFALEGIKTFFITQHNAWLHLLAALTVTILGVCFHLNTYEWCWIVIAVVLVFMAELFNTAIEFLSNVVSPNIHPEIKKVKDVSAAAVLVTALGAVIIGVIIFIPKIYYLFCAV